MIGVDRHFDKTITSFRVRQGFLHHDSDEFPRCIMQLAAVLFGLAALGGLTMAVIRLTGTPRPPTWLALGHGTIAACGLITLIYTAATQPLPTLAIASLGIFVFAALGGITIFALFHLREKPLPIPFVLGHGALAVTGLVLLLLAIFQ
jgi:hypothetical protein